MHGSASGRRNAGGQGAVSAIAVALAVLVGLASEGCSGPHGCGVDCARSALLLAVVDRSTGAPIASVQLVEGQSPVALDSFNAGLCVFSADAGAVSDPSAGGAFPDGGETLCVDQEVEVCAFGAESANCLSAGTHQLVVSAPGYASTSFAALVAVPTSGACGCPAVSATGSDAVRVEQAQGWSVATASLAHQ